MEIKKISFIGNYIYILVLNYVYNLNEDFILCFCFILLLVYCVILIYLILINEMKINLNVVYKGGFLLMRLFC